jgi:hypothetical protein
MMDLRPCQGPNRRRCLYERCHEHQGGRIHSRITRCTVAEIADEIISQVALAVTVSREHDRQTSVVTPAKTWPENDAERDAFVDWQFEVSQGDTLRGFRDWLAAEKERVVDQS